MSKVVFEIFSEELPATLQKRIIYDFENFSKKELKRAGIEFDVGNVFVGITLNRLVIKVDDCKIAKEQLRKFVDTTLKEFSNFFPRTMNYPQLQVVWIRPIRNIFACIDDDVLIDNVYGIKTKNCVYVDKFSAYVCNSVEEYEKIINDNGIVLDYNKRVEFVKRMIKENDLSKSYSNNSLINEIAGMSEYCVEPMVDVLDDRFNVLPFELIELVLRENQRYVVFTPNDKGEIKFLIFGEKNTEDIKNGHRKVVNARLDDALFYWLKDEDLKRNKEELKNILFKRTFVDDITWEAYLNQQNKLFNGIFENEEKISIDAKNGIRRLIIDTKLDLSTGVVAEFPELQGVIGGYYFNYNFNPYNLDEEKIKSFMNNDKNATVEVLFFYLIDRLTYIKVMYQQGKQPTGSGDKYKVKARMEDVVKIFGLFAENGLMLSNSLVVKIISILKENDEVYQLFKKRYQKYIEDKFKDCKNIKQFAEVCVKMVENENFKLLLSTLKNEIMFFNDSKFVKIYKRINGYTKEAVDFAMHAEIEDKIKEIFPNNDILSIDDYLDNHKISDDENTKCALKCIEERYFLPKLPCEFLEIA